MPASRLLSVAVIVLFLAGPLAAHATDACSLLSKDQIKAATQDPVTHSGGMPNSCIWSGKNSTIYIGIRDGNTWSTTKSAFQKYGQIQSVSGVGDDAFFQSPDDPKPTLYARHGSQFITIRVNVKGFSTEETKGALKTLGAEAAAKL